jgi:hypothetical protein
VSRALFTFPAAVGSHAGAAVGPAPGNWRSAPGTTLSWTGCSARRSSSLEPAARTCLTSTSADWTWSSAPSGWTRSPARWSTSPSPTRSWAASRVRRPAGRQAPRRHGLPPAGASQAARAPHHQPPLRQHFPAPASRVLLGRPGPSFRTHAATSRHHRGRAGGVPRCLLAVDTPRIQGHQRPVQQVP